MPSTKRATLIAIFAFAGIAYSQADAPLNDLPNPYRTVRDWAQPPGGAPWAAVTAIEMAPDGGVYVIHRCSGNSCAGKTEPPILKFDKSGKLLKKELGRGAVHLPARRDCRAARATCGSPTRR